LEGLGVDGRIILTFELKEIRQEVVDSIYLAHNLDHFWHLVEKIINLRGPREEENF